MMLIKTGDVIQRQTEKVTMVTGEEAAVAQTGEVEAVVVIARTITAQTSKETRPKSHVTAATRLVTLWPTVPINCLSSKKL